MDAAAYLEGVFICWRLTNLELLDSLEQKLLRLMLHMDKEAGIRLVEDLSEAGRIGVQQEQFSPKTFGFVVIVFDILNRLAGSPFFQVVAISYAEQSLVQTNDFRLEDIGPCLLGQGGLFHGWTWGSQQSVRRGLHGRNKQRSGFPFSRPRRRSGRWMCVVHVIAHTIA